MKEPCKKELCKGCRAKSFVQCLTACMYMREGIACRENIDYVTEPIEFTAEVQQEGE
jgi:hypothetical protein